MRHILSIWLKSVWVVAVVVVLPLSSLFADQFRSRQTGNWNDITSPATWEISTDGGTTWSESTTRYPGQGVADDTVLVRNGHTVTLNVSPANALGLLTVGEGASGALSIGGQTITISGAVTVNNGATVTVTSATGTKSFGSLVLNSGATWNSNAGETYSISGSLTLNGASIGGTGTGVFNVGTDFLVSGTNSIAAATLSVTGSTIVDGTLTFSSITGVKTFNDVSINPGGSWLSSAAETYAINGNLTMNGGTIDGSATGILNVGGNFTVASGTNTLGRATISVTGITNVNSTLQLTNTNGTKTFNDVNINSGGSWSSIAAETYAINGNLTMNGGTIDGTATGILTVSGNFTIASGTNTLGNATITVTGTTDISGTLDITSNTGTKTFVGKITINNGGTWDNSIGNSDIVLRGGLENNGTFTSGTGTYTFNTNSQTISGTNGLTFAATGTSLAITGAITITNQTTVTVAGSMTGSAGGSTWLNDVNSTLNVAGALLTTGTLTATATPNLVNYNGTGAQTIKAANYNDLTISGARTTNNVTLANGGTIGISGTFTPSATFTTGNYVTTNNTVNFNGTGTQTIPPLGTANYNNVTKSGSGTAQLSDNLGIAGNLTVSGGVLDLMTYTADRVTAGGTLTIGAGATLRIGGTNSYPANYTTNTLNVASTVEYYGSTQTISSTPTYGNLTLSGSGPKTTPTGTTTTTVAGNFTLGSGITYERASGATSTLTLNGTTNVNDGTLGSLANPFNTINVGNAGGDNLTNNGIMAVATSLAGSGSLTQGANATLYIGGTFTTTTVNLTAEPNLVEYNGTGAQTIRATNYNDLTISGSRTTNNVTLPNGGTVGISGTFTPSATFTTGNYVTTGNTVNFNGSGTQTIPPLGTANYNNVTKSGSGTAQLSDNLGIAGNLTVSGGVLDLMTYTANRATAGGTLTIAAGATLRIGGTGTIPSNYTTHSVSATSTVEYYGGNQTVAVLNSAQNYGNLLISGTGTKTLAGTVGVAGNLTISSSTFDLGTFTVNRTAAGGTLTVASGATLKIGGTNTLPSNYSTHSIGATSTIEYAGTTNTVAALNSSQSYGNLVISATGATTTNSFSVATSLNVTAAGSFVASGASVVTMNNGSSITNAGTLTFSGLTIPASATVTVNNGFTVNGVLTLGSDLDMGSNTLTLGSAATVTSTGDVLGAVFRSGLATGTAYAFNNQYTTITFSGSAPTNVTSVLTRGAAPSGKSDAIQRYYTISNTGGFGTATLRLRYLDSELNGNTELDLVLWKDVSGTWTEQGRTGSVDVTNNFVELAGVTSFSAWTLANNLLDHFAVSFTSPQTSGVAFTGTNTITAQDAGNRTVTRFNAATNNVTVTATPNDGTITGLGSGNNDVLNQASDFVNGVANVTGSLVFSGLTGNHTFTATSANGKTGTSGTVTINASTTNWVGGTSNNWNDPANWSNGVPGAGTNVVIGSATFRPRVPTTGASTFDLTINNGGYLEWESCGGVLNIYGQLTIVNGGTMDLGTCTPANQVVFHGNFTINNGGAIQAGNGIIDLKGSSWQNNPGSSFNAGTSTVIVDGTGNQTISGNTSITFYNLTVNNSPSTLTISSDVVVANTMTITSGSTVDVQATGSLTVVGDFVNNGTAPSVKPYIISADAVSTTQVDVTFSEPVQQISAETATNYSIRLQSGGTLSISSAVRDGTNTAVVHLTPSSALTPGNVDTLVVNNVQDLSGGDVIQANSRKRITSAALNVFYSRASGNWNDVNTWSFVSHVGAAASRLPGSATGDSVIVGNNHTVTLDVNVSNLNLVRVNSTGTLNTGTFVISGSGAFELNAGGTLGIGSADGITASGASGNIQTTTRSFSTGANYTYNGTSAQVTGNGLPSTVNNLTISNAAGVTLTASTSLTGDLTVSSGTFDLGANNANRSSSGGTLTLGAGTTLKIGGTGSLPSNYTAHSINSSSTVEYNGTNQTVAALNSSQNYGTLIISGSGTKTLAGNIGIVNDLTISGGRFDLSTFTANRTVSGGSLTLSSGATLTVGGSSGGLTGSNFPANFSTLTLNGTVEYNGTGAQTIAPLVYTHVLFNNGGTKTIDGTITFNGDFTVNAGAVVVVAATGDIQINGNLVVGGSFTNNGTISIGN